MLTSVHLITGAAIGVAIREPLLVVPIAIASHYILDFIPHYAPKPITSFKSQGFKEVALKELFLKSLEPIVGLAIVLIMMVLAGGNLKLSISLGAFFAWFPDYITFLDWKYNLKFPSIIRFIEKYAHKNKYHRHISALRGLPLQFVVSLIGIVYVLIKLKH